MEIGPARRTLIALLFAWAAYSRYTLLQMQRLDRTGAREVWTVRDPQTTPGIRYTTTISSQASNNDFVTVQALYRAGAEGFVSTRPGSLPEHVHPEQHEQVVVESGTLHYMINGEVGSAEAGETVDIPAGARHMLWCDGPGGKDLLTVTTVRPGMGYDILLDNLAGLTAQYGSITLVNPMQLIVTFSRFGVHLAGVPTPLRRLVGIVLVPFGRMMGFKPEYPQYASLKDV